MKRGPTEVDLLMLEQLEELSTAPWVFKEFRFCTTRQWRFDFAILDGHGADFGIEIEGGVWVRGGGGHNRGKAFIDDMEKYNHAALLGWRVLRFTPQQVLKGEAIAFIRKVLES